MRGQISGLRGPGGLTDGCTDEQKSPCVLKDFVPFGGRCPKSKNLNLSRREFQVEAFFASLSYSDLILMQEENFGAHILKQKMQTFRLAHKNCEGEVVMHK